MNIPNILTMVRFCLIPLFIIVFYSPIDHNVLYSTLIFALAGVTDVLDGHIARSYNMVTRWGIVLDPLADKLMEITVLVCFTSANYLPLWVIIVIGIKEICMIFGAIFLYYSEEKTVVPSNIYGKIATFSFYIAIFAIAINLNKTVNFILIGITVILTIIAFINYFIAFREIRKESK
ncbi:CDP-diacylglycerol--glycerol-3-phosphate 3-phosphatidyltransferase PgsA [Gottschalkia purinilytica]|uniref:CDP-diacylglycerol--glycerol-3-phosphate 3-phosphatidyltransferase n=1 Tax=Gottschalkia purinilytica TaxID=1503 RepID=A0A0L0W889_GOTPU|nr:CDP-diacylglycerol--glycerol-3-phosphate 3-phosphatidyltransferase [Gottschalkia purinilytica]KNF07667.1 CDP-diacylglycerol--glycerol-3-phosphate 3-phosphatidyltransferase PgsA [Gottschalkia purinilytica]